MLNLELVGVSLYSAVSLIRAFFCASPVATRYVSPFLRHKNCGAEDDYKQGSAENRRLEYYL